MDMLQNVTEDKEKEIVISLVNNRNYEGLRKAMNEWGVPYEDIEEASRQALVDKSVYKGEQYDYHTHGYPTLKEWFDIYIKKLKKN
jgi:hypothetical protein